MDNIIETNRLIDLIYENDEIKELFFSHPYLLFSVIKVDLNHNKGRLTYFSPSWMEITEYSEDDLKSINFLDCIHEDDHKMFYTEKDFIQKTGNSGMLFNSYRFKKKNGEYIRLQGIRSQKIADNTYLMIKFVIPEGEYSIEKYTPEFSEFIKKEKSNFLHDQVIKQFLSDSNFKISFFNSDQILYCFMGSDFTIHKISPSSSKVLGYKPEDLEGDDIMKIADKKAFEDSLPMYQYMSVNKRKSFLYHPATYRNKKGDKVKFQCLDPIYIKKGDMWLLRAYLIDNKTEGITVLTDEYKKYIENGGN